MKAWTRRPRLVVGNWKMHKTPAEGAALARDLQSRNAGGGRARVAVCPPFPALAAVAAELAGTPFLLGAQNLHPEPAGAFTGEVSGAMLAACGCRLVIVGHSERRHGMGEDDALVARKLRAAQRDALTPIVCIGETLAEREANRSAEMLERQVSVAYAGLRIEAALATVIAYEPVWAIGTGRVATRDQAVEAHLMIRATLDRVVGPGCGAGVAVLYGGSVNAGNASGLFEAEDIDGALVGGASLEADSFARIAAGA